MHVIIHAIFLHLLSFQRGTSSVQAAWKAKCWLVPITQILIMQVSHLSLYIWRSSPSPYFLITSISTLSPSLMILHPMGEAPCCTPNVLHYRLPNNFFLWLASNITQKLKDGCPMQEESTDPKLLISFLPTMGLLHIRVPHMFPNRMVVQSTLCEPLWTSQN